MQVSGLEATGLIGLVARGGIEAATRHEERHRLAAGQQPAPALGRPRGLDCAQAACGACLRAGERGDVKKALFFRGVGSLPFGDQIRSVRDLMLRLPTQGEAVTA